MKKSLAFLTALFFAASAQAADVYKFDPNHTSVTWSAGHFGYSNPSGKFTDIDGTITIDEQNPQQSEVNVTVRTESLVTGLQKFDQHLKSKDFLDTDKFPNAKFVSTSVSPMGKTAAKVRGNLTLLGTTLPVTLDVKLNKIGIHPITQKKTVGFSATTSIKRSQFGMRYGLPGVPDMVKISIESEATISSEASSSGSKDNAGEWKINQKNSSIQFSARHDSSNIGGSFKEFKGQLNFDPKQLQTSKVMIEIDTTSVDVDFEEAVQAIKEAGWLAVNTFPKAIFTAEKFTALGNKNTYRATGTLTLKGKSVPVAVDFTLNEYSDVRANATGRAVIKRSSFGVGDKDPKKSNGIRDEVTVTFTINAER